MSCDYLEKIQTRSWAPAHSSLPSRRCLGKGLIVYHSYPTKQSWSCTAGGLVGTEESGNRGPSSASGLGQKERGKDLQVPLRWRPRFAGRREASRAPGSEEAQQSPGPPEQQSPATGADKGGGTEPSSSPELRAEHTRASCGASGSGKGRRCGGTGKWA